MARIGNKNKQANEGMMTMRSRIASMMILVSRTVLEQSDILKVT